MKVLLFSVILFILANVPGIPVCNDIQLSLITTNTSEGQNNGKIEVKVEKGHPPFKVYLYAEKRKDNKLDIKFKDLENLAPGKYLLVVQDKGECTFQESIVIK